MNGHWRLSNSITPEPQGKIGVRSERKTQAQWKPTATVFLLTANSGECQASVSPHYLHFFTVKGLTVHSIEWVRSEWHLVKV